MPQTPSFKIDLPDDEPMIGAGLLGVEVPASQASSLADARLNEIERRILAIEERLRNA